MTDNTQPEALRLANEFKLCNEYDSIPSMNDIARAEAELRRQHTRIAELEADHFEDKLDMVARWYMVDKDGMATLCTDREDAEQEAKYANMAWPHLAPHRAVQLVEVGTSAAELHPSPPEGMVGGLQDIASAPKDGTRILLHPAVEVHDSWSKGYWSEPQECWIVGGSASGVAHTYWLPLPPAQTTTSAGSGKGE